MDDFWSLALDKMDAYVCLKPLEVDVDAIGEESSEDDDDDDDEDDDGSDTDAEEGDGDGEIPATRPETILEEPEPEEEEVVESTAVRSTVHLLSVVRVRQSY